MSNPCRACKFSFSQDMLPKFCNNKGPTRQQLIIMVGITPSQPRFNVFFDISAILNEHQIIKT